MEQGSLRADVNLSIRPVEATELGTRTEMKNINSFKAISRAIEAEQNRQITIIAQGGTVVQETRRWDDAKGESYAMRSKENAQDYRYFPEPDLVPIEISDEWIQRVCNELPELPDVKKQRYMSQYQLPEYDIDIIIGFKHLVTIFEEALEVCNEPKEVSNWIMGELLRLAADTSTEIENINFTFANLGKLILIVKNNIINRTAAKEVFEMMFKEDIDPEKYIKENNLEMVCDDNLVRNIVKAVFEANPKSLEEFKCGNDKVLRFLMGQCMKELKGKANPSIVNEIIDEQLKKI